MSLQRSNVKAPDWVPFVVDRVAQRLGAEFRAEGRADLIAVLRRLIFDGRMQKVWRELTKRRRENYVSTERPFHPSTLPQAVELWAATAAALRRRAAEYRELGDEIIACEFEHEAALAQARHQNDTSQQITDPQRHDLALVMTFFLAVAHYLAGAKTVTQKEFNAHVDRLRAAGKMGIVDALERHAADPQVARFIVKRRRTDPRLEGFVEAVASEVAALFGDQFYGVIATLANVVFERCDLTRQRIRAILKVRTRVVGGPR